MRVQFHQEITSNLGWLFVNIELECSGGSKHKIEMSLLCSDSSDEARRG